MSRTPFNRWDLGGAAPDGARHPYVEDRRYQGSQFAVLFDRQWEFICTHRYWANSPYDDFLPRMCVEADFPTLSDKTMRAYRKELVYDAWNFADWLVSVPTFEKAPDGGYSVIDKTCMAAAPCSQPHSDLPSVRKTIRRIAAECREGQPFTPTDEDRIEWLIDGFIRHENRACRSLSDLEENIGKWTNVAARCEVFDHRDLHKDLERRRLISPIETALYERFKG
jgi:hypothetical protein